MSIVGTQSVSMSDLMKLGPQALGSMAQGQTQSIAPSYMVLAALKALTDQQKGMQTQVPGQTIKDQVVAQATPPAQAGIGAMAPQGFADGGTVGSHLGRSAGANLLPDQTGYEGMGIGEFLRAIAGKGIDFAKRAVDSVSDWDKDMKTAVRGTEATTPTGEGRSRLAESPYVPEQELAEETPAVAAPQPGGSASMSASSTARAGIGGSSGSPFQRYGPNEVKPKSLGEIEGLDIPKDQFLEDAISKYSKPNEARMAELKEAERNAGLGAFAKGILKGRGFGGAFGPAVADSFSAENAQAEKRREYEDARERTALELGLKKGSREYENFFKNVDYKKGEREFDTARQSAEQKRGDTQIDKLNEYNLERAKLAMQAEGHRLAASVRQDGLDRQKFDKLLALQQGASKVAQDYVDGYVKANPSIMADPKAERKLADMRQVEYERLFPKDLEELMRQGLGLSGTPAQSAGTGKVYRGEMK